MGFAPMSLDHGYCLFETAIGCCGMAWGAAGIVAVQLPEANAAATRARLLRRAQSDAEVRPPPAVQRAIDDVCALLQGEARDFASVRLDCSGVPDFHRRVYALARAIPPGATRTYGDIAAELGDRGAARAVGQALGRNPFAPIVPCHRVLAAGGRIGGFSATGGAATKRRMLAIEAKFAGGSPGLFD